MVEEVKIRVFRLPHAQDLPLPERATSGSSGCDLRAAVDVPVVLEPGRRALIPTGLRMEIPTGWEGQVRPRSGLSVRYGVTLVNSPGTVDSDYRGEIRIPLINLGPLPSTSPYTAWQHRLGPFARRVTNALLRSV